MNDSQAEAMRKAMMLDAEWHRADSKFHAACEDKSGISETSRQRHIAREKAYHADPERQKRRNAQRRAQRAAARANA
jgi:hypothetical protein